MSVMLYNKSIINKQMQSFIANKKLLYDIKEILIMAKQKQFEEVSYHEVIDSIAEKTGKSKKDSYEFFTAFREAIAEELYEGHSVRLPRLATFELVEQGPRESRSPATGEPVHVPAKVVVKVRRKKLLNDVPEQVEPRNH